MKIIAKVVPTILIIAAVIGFKFFRSKQSMNDIKEQVIVALQADMSPTFEKEYVKELVDYAHPFAIDGSYSIGGRRRSDKFDEDQYIDALHVKITEKLIADGKQAEAAAYYGQ